MNGVAEAAKADRLNCGKDGKSVFFAEPIAGTADERITLLVGVVMPIADKADRIQYQVIMDMVFVYMDGKYKLVTAAQSSFCKLYTDFVGLFRCAFPGLKSWYQMAAQMRTLIYGLFSCLGKFNICGFRRIANGGRQKFLVRLGGITDICAYVDHISR